MATSYGPTVILPATYEMDNLQHVAVSKNNVLQCRTGNNLQITFDRDLGRIKADIADQISDSGLAAKSAQLAIERQGDRIGGKGRGHFISLFSLRRI